MSFFFNYRVQRTPPEDRTKHLGHRPSETENTAKGSDMTEIDLEKQRAMLLAQLKEPESD